jgi:cytochrome c biogenesis protein CcmG/thiol:disulfide interchange protein DsbE
VNGDHTSADVETQGWSRGQRFGIGVGVFLAATIVALLIIGLVKPDQQFTIDRNIAENKAPTAPDISLPVLAAAAGVGPEGAIVSLASLRGKPVVLNVWASWCIPCRNEAPILQRLANTYGPRGAVILGVNVRDLTGDAKAFIDKYHLTFPSLRDGSDHTERRLETTGVPETFIIDADGKMRILPIRGELTSAGERDIAAHLDKVLAK